MCSWHRAVIYCHSEFKHGSQGVLQRVYGITKLLFCEFLVDYGYTEATIGSLDFHDVKAVESRKHHILATGMKPDERLAIVGAETSNFKDITELVPPKSISRCHY